LKLRSFAVAGRPVALRPEQRNWSHAWRYYRCKRLSVNSRRAASARKCYVVLGLIWGKLERRRRRPSSSRQVDYEGHRLPVSPHSAEIFGRYAEPEESAIPAGASPFGCPQHCASRPLPQCPGADARCTAKRMARRHRAGYVFDVMYDGNNFAVMIQHRNVDRVPPSQQPSAFASAYVVALSCHPVRLAGAQHIVQRCR
jgi:hypothetical protein